MRRRLHVDRGARKLLRELSLKFLVVTLGEKGMRVYDVASIGNKGVSQKIISAP